MRPLVIIIFLGLLFVIATALIPRYEKDSETLSPNNPGNSGTQALVQTLRHHGIKVVKVTSARELIARSTPDSTAVITYPGYMPDATATSVFASVRYGEGHASAEDCAGMDQLIAAYSQNKKQAVHA